MLISNEDAIKRLNSPLNLINSLRSNGNGRSKAMSLFVPSKERIEQELKEEKKILDFNPFVDKTSIIPPIVSETPTQLIPAASPKIDDLISNHDSQVKLSLAHDSALELLTDSISELKLKLSDMKPEKLPAVIAATSKVVESIRRERNEAKANDKDKEVHYHFYTPVQKKISEFAVIDV